MAMLEIPSSPTRSSARLRAASASSDADSKRCLEDGDRTGWTVVKRPRSASSASDVSMAPSECESKGEEEMASRLASSLRVTECSSSDPARRGLLNLGNSCYMNAVLQCLAHADAFARPYLATPEPASPGGTSSEGAGEREVASALRELLAELREPGAALRPVRLKRALGRVRRDFAGRRQQDAQELLRCLLDAAHEGGNLVRGRVPYEEIKDVAGESAAETAQRWWAHFEKRNLSPVADAFAGQLASETRCERCGTVSRAFDPVFDLSIPLPPEGDGEVQLADCLRAFTAAERMDGGDAAYCGTCKSHGPATRALALQRAPRVLVLHLKRFSAGGGGKVRTPVALPMREDLDMAPFLSADAAGGTACRYRLTGAVHHSGGMSGGHYTASVRGAGNRWLRANDDWVSDAVDTDVDAATAYLLFLERTDEAPSQAHL